MKEKVYFFVNTWLQRIKEKKRAMGMTNEELSEKTGIPQGTLNKILTGVSDDPKLSTLTALARVFDVSIDYIVYGDGEALHLSKTEEELIRSYRALDKTGRELVSLVVSKEAERFAPAEEEAPAASSRVLSPGRFKFTSEASAPAADSRFRLPLYDLPVSAGRGSLLDGTGAEYITLTSGGTTLDADFALRVSGNSMEPRYLDGDIILVHEQPDVGIGELGIFVCSDGVTSEGYFKRFGGDRLISINPEYDDIYLDGFKSVICRGKVIGRLPRK